MLSKQRAILASTLLALCVGTLGIDSLPSVAQAAATHAKLTVFEVVSFRPNKSGSDKISTISFTPDGFRATNVPVMGVLLSTYWKSIGPMSRDRIVGAPSWVRSDLYDIDAKVGPSDVKSWQNLSDEEHCFAVHALLADRFKMRSHLEDRQVPGYALVIGKSGSKLREAKPGDTYANAPKEFDRSPTAAGSLMYRPTGPLIQITGQAVPIADLVTLLSSRPPFQGGRHVIDRTGLTGKYDFLLKYSLDQESDSSESSIFTAIQEQLGLRLDPAVILGKYLVIDYIERPSPN